jgi:transcriptional regulator with XRE-family HTH domain
VAERSGLDRAVISRLENGKRDIPTADQEGLGTNQE